MAPTLIACPNCACHAKSTESTCPSCGEPLRRKDGSLPRAAVAVFLGLTTATVGVLSACSSSTSGGEGGSATTSSSSGPAAAYGIAQTTGSNSTSSSSSTSGAAAYGIAQTTSSSSGGAGGNDGG